MKNVNQTRSIQAIVVYASKSNDKTLETLSQSLNLKAELFSIF